MSMALPCIAADQPDSKPRRQQMGWFESVKSPEILPDGNVVFRLFAPHAREVKLNSQFGPETPMTWDDDEQVWKVTVRPAVPDIYPYSFVVDGTPINDPANKEIFPNELFKQSLLEMPDTSSVATVRDIEHGQVRYCTYRSSVLGENRNMLVYTPAGYDRDTDRDYPVFYLVSGTTDTEETWHKAGRANVIADNLAADGKASEMIIVMPYGYMNTGNPQPSSDAAAECYEIFAREMAQCVMPYVESHFRVRPGRENSAIAGFSRGGGEALYTAFSMPDRFAAVCAYSAYLPDRMYETRLADMINSPEATNDRYDLIWFGVGDSDILVDGVRRNREYFRDKGIRFVQYDTTGGHTWMNARKFLAETLPLLFGHGNGK